MARETLQKISQAVQDGDLGGVEALTRQALHEGFKPQEIINDGLSAGMSAIGKLFREELVYVPEVLVAAKAMQTGLDVLAPILAGAPVAPKAKAVIGTVEGDLHDIGKNLVIILLKGAGLEVHDLGMNVPPGKFVSAIRELKPDLVGMSCLLTTTMPAMSEAIQAIEKAGLRKQVKIIVGGQPITEAYAHKAGADGYAPDAAHAVEKVQEMLGI